MAYQQWQQEFDWQKAQAEMAAASRSSSGSGTRKSTKNQTEEPAVDIEAEYLAMKKSGASPVETDKYLKAAISAGLISMRDATDLREKRY